MSALFHVCFDGTTDLTTLERYALLDRVARLAKRREVVWWGFDVRDDIQLLLSGEDLEDLVRALKSGTTQARLRGSGRRLLLGPSLWRPVPHLGEALVELHRTGGSPLESLWTSHRDLMGYRDAPFFDAEPVRQTIDARWVHIRAEGRDLPQRWPEMRPVDLNDILQVSAEVLGVAPADRRSFPLFVQLARWQGTRQIDIAQALQLTPRRIRQLQSRPEPRLQAAAHVLHDARFRRPRRNA